MRRQSKNWLAIAGISLFAMIFAAGCSVIDQQEREPQTLQLEGTLFRLSSELDGLGNIDVPGTRLSYPSERFGAPIVRAIAYGAIELRAALRPDRKPLASTSEITGDTRAALLADMRRNSEAITIMPVPVPSASLDLEITNVMEQVGLWQIAIFGLSRQPSSVADLQAEDIVWAGLDIDYVRNVYRNGARSREASVWLEPLCGADDSIDACADSDGDGIPDAVDLRLVASPESAEITIPLTIAANSAIISDIQLLSGLDGQALPLSAEEAPELVVEATDNNGESVQIGVDNNPFAIDPVNADTFQVIVRAPGQLEPIYTYRIALSAIRPGSDSDRSTLDYEVNVRLVALESSDGQIARINENDTGTTPITTISFAYGASAAEVDPYDIIAGNSDGIFSIDDRGLLTVANWDYDTADPNGLLRSITVQGTSSVGDVGTIEISVSLLNIDDEAPEFDPIPQGVTIEAGSTALSQTIDLDAADDLGLRTEIRYSFVNGAGVESTTLNGFAIDAATGQISVATAPVYTPGDAAANRFELRARATDISSEATEDTFSEVTVTITVVISFIELRATSLTGMPARLLPDGSIGITINEDDAATADREVSRISIATSGASPAATSPYSIIAGNDDGYFAIDGSGVITAVQALDYEALFDTTGSNVFSVTARGVGAEEGQERAIQLEITVANIDDEAPEFDPIPQGVTLEAGSTTLSRAIDLDATDDLGTEIRYSFVNGAGVESTALNGFAIDAETGNISVATAPVYTPGDAAANRFELRARATDISSGATGDTFSDTTVTIVVVISSIELRATSLTGIPARLLPNGSIGITINEDDAATTARGVALISFVSPGVTPAATAPYSIIAGNDDGYFAIDDSGVINAVQVFDYEAFSDTTGSNIFSVTARGVGAVEGQESTIQLEITVANIDDEAPRFATNFARETSVGAYSTIMIPEVDLDAFDDVGDDEIKFVFVDGSGNEVSRIDEFDIDSVTGVISMRSHHNYGRGHEEVLTARAVDISEGIVGSERMVETTITVRLNVVDIDGDGLIEIYSFSDLDQINHREDGAGKKRWSSDFMNVNGCPEGVCNGYELTRDLDFLEATSYRDNFLIEEWVGNNKNDIHSSNNRGWLPIGRSSIGFSGIFDGNGYVIKNLYSRNTGSLNVNSMGHVGLFSRNIGTIRNLGVIGASLHGSNETDRIGSIVAWNNGSIIASYASSEGTGGETIIWGRNGNDAVGGLVGHNNGLISISYALSVRSHGGNGDDSVGGFVGINCGRILHSYALFTQANGTASSSQDGDLVGALVGSANCGSGYRSIRASYAAYNDIKGGANSGRYVQRVIGDTRRSNIYAVFEEGSTISAGRTTSSSIPNGNGEAFPGGIRGVDESSAPSSFIDSAWDYGSSSQFPRLRYADYDGPGDFYTCDGIPDRFVCGATLLRFQNP